MRVVSQRFLDALKAYHRLVSVFTYQIPGGSPVVLNVQSGQVSSDASQRVRRTASLAVYGSQADYQAMTTPGTVFHIDHGIDYGGGQTELVPLFHGELTDSEQRIGDGTIQLTLADHMNWLTRVRLLKPYAPDASTSRVAAISALVTDGRPGTVLAVTATDTGTIGSQNVWTNSRVDAITSLCRDGSMDAFFQPDGSFLICDLPDANTAAVWTAQGVLESVSRKRPMDKLYNTVVVQPSATDGSQTWVQQVAQVTDLGNRRHPSYIGVVPYFWPSPTAGSAYAALAAAKSILFRVLGTTETLSLGLISNPALETNDVIRVVSPQVNTDPAQIFQHFIDSSTLDLVTGSMTLATRSQAVSTT
jgi:hypothetical protein